jgi:hypothetical protein
VRQQKNQETRPSLFNSVDVQMNIIQNYNIYIQPRLKYYSTFEQLLKSKAEYGNYDFFYDDKFSFKDILAKKSLFILSEPGYGKTRLLKEIILCAPEQNKQGIFIDLKKVDKDIESFIMQKIAISDEINDKLSEAKLKTSSFLKTKDFALQDTDITIVCLDALDEIKYEDFSKFVDRIKEFSSKYKNIHLFVSCRSHHFKKEQESFVETNFNFIEIIPFSNEQTHEYLESSGLSHNDIKKIMALFETAYRNPLIQVPRYLELMIEIIKDKGAEYARKLTKTEIFEYFISKKLELEEKRTTTKKKEIIKRVQEKLALLMEIYQTNILSKEELMTFFDDVESNLNISLLQQVPLEAFINRSLLKDNIDTIEFENTEFQEYLAAKEMLRLGRADQSIFDIAVDQDIREIFPSWFNSLGFAIDLDISLLKPILHFGTSRNSIVQDEEYHRLLTMVDTNRLPVKDKKDIFRNIFNYYNEVQHWISYDIARNLSHYFDVSQHSLLKESIESETATYITKRNTASILEFLIEINVFKQPQKAYWKSKLIEFIKEKNSVLQRAAISALSQFKDITLIKQVSEYMNTEDNAVIQALVDACRQAEPNNKFSIDCFVKWTKNDREYIHARYGLYEVKEKKAIEYLLDCFINDPEFLTQFMDHESIFNHRDDQIIQNIKDNWDNKIQNKLHKIVVSAFSHDQWYVTDKSQFIKRIAGLLGEKDRNYIFRLIAEIKRSNKFNKHLFGIIPVFLLLLEKAQVGKFVYELKEIGEERCALRTLQSTWNSKKELYEEGRKYFSEEYAETEKQWKSEAKKNKAKDIYRDFQFKLEPQKGMYDTGVFDFYLRNEEHLRSVMTSQNKNRLEKLLIKSIFDKFDPGEQKLTITSREGGQTTYTTSSFIHIFGDCLRVAESLKIDISKYRQRIINYIPFAYSEHRQSIISLIPNLTTKEISGLLKLYIEKRDDDLQKFMPESFIYASERYGIVEAVPVLKRFVVEKAFLMQDRTSSLRVIAIIQPDETYFKAIFRKYKDNKDTYQLAEDANKYLIEKFSNKEAIKWRLGQIVKNTFSYISPKGVYTVSPQESELCDKHFASPILKLKHPRYKKQLLSLLKKSFFIYRKGVDYHSYAQYLWDIVEVYFYNLRETKSYIHLKDLENYIQKHSSEEGINWFKYKLHKLKVEYMRYIGKPQSIAECIKKYNKLKATQYLDIATSADLVEVVKKVINEELKRWVEDDGAYKFISYAKYKQEDLIQKTIKTQFENCLLKKELRGNEINIRREEQLLDDKRTDFLISYGFIGPVLIEIKLSHNPEIANNTKRRAYKKKILQYIKGTKSDIGIFLIFEINNKYSIKDYIPKVKELYKDCDNVEVIGLACVKD